MLSRAHPAHLICIGFFLIYTASAAVADKFPPHYEECWQILEELCEHDGSNGCGKLVKLCGHLLTEHLKAHHEPSVPSSCPHDHAQIKKESAKHRRMVSDIPWPMTAENSTEEARNDTATGLNDSSDVKKIVNPPILHLLGHIDNPKPSET